MEPWYKVVQPRDEVREGRSFNPDEFAIALQQAVAGGDESVAAVTLEIRLRTRRSARSQDMPV
jgi:hypothetical protein